MNNADSYRSALAEIEEILFDDLARSRPTIKARDAVLKIVSDALYGPEQSHTGNEPCGATPHEGRKT